MVLTSMPLYLSMHFKLSGIIFRIFVFLIVQKSLSDEKD